LFAKATRLIFVRADSLAARQECDSNSYFQYNCVEIWLRKFFSAIKSGEIYNFIIINNNKVAFTVFAQALR